MKRVMIQADRNLLERARLAAQERGVSFPQLVREAIERDLAVRSGPPPRLTSAGSIDTAGEARKREYTPDAWR